MIELGWDGRRIRETLAGIYRDGAIQRIAAGDRRLLDEFLRSLGLGTTQE